MYVQCNFSLYNWNYHATKKLFKKLIPTAWEFQLLNEDMKQHEFSFIADRNVKWYKTVWEFLIEHGIKLS
jgi:hypothetical protein